MDFKGWLYALTQHLDEDEEGGNDSDGGAEEEAKASDGLAGGNDPMMGDEELYKQIIASTNSQGYWEKEMLDAFLKAIGGKRNQIQPIL